MSWINKKFFFTIIMLSLILIIVEILSTLAVHYRYKKFNTAIANTGFSSTYLIINRVLVKLNFINANMPNHDFITSHPKPFLGPSDVHGYTTMPGAYTVRHYDHYNENLYSESRVTILDDGTRYVGEPKKNTTKKVFVFGDSFFFGEGVNDEHTFTFLLQNKNRDKKFYLHAAGGWSLSNALVNIIKLKEDIDSNDIVILGYADYYKVRHVAAPQRMREYGSPRQILPSGLGHLKLSVDDSDEIVSEIIPLFCKDLGNYCKQPDPSEEYMNKVTRNLINEIATHLDARIILLHMVGDLTDPALVNLDSKIEVVPATVETFKYEIKDNIMGFDGHPGPYWHHAIFSRLQKILVE